MKYRFMGKEKLLALGVWPSVSLTEARKKRNESKLILKSGADPSMAKKNQKLTQYIRQSNTFGSVTEEWLEMKQKEGRMIIWFIIYLFNKDNTNDLKRVFLIIL